MKPQDDYGNGDGGAASAASHSDDSEGEEASALEQELSLDDRSAPARALAALNALRKSRQHYDVVLAAAGAEVAAHRAVLAAVAPRLLAALAPPAAAPDTLRLPGLDADALRELVEYAYTGRLRVRDAAAARRLYRAAARLRIEPARAHLAERLLRRVEPHDCLALRELPDLAPAHRAALDAYIAQHFDEICESGALAALPLVRIELLRETSADGGEEAPAAVAGAALAWLRDHHAADVDLEELCSRTHLLFVDAAGELRDCGELPAALGDAPELQEYRREAHERGRAGRRRDAPEPAGDSVVIAARASGGGTRAVLALRGRLAAARVAARTWRWGAARWARRRWARGWWCAAGTTARACCARPRRTTRRPTVGRRCPTCRGRARASRPRGSAPRSTCSAAPTDRRSWTRSTCTRRVRRGARGVRGRACRWRARTRRRRRTRRAASCTCWAAGRAAAACAPCTATRPPPTAGRRRRRCSRAAASAPASSGRTRSGRSAAATPGTASRPRRRCRWAGGTPAGRRGRRCPRRGARRARRCGAGCWWRRAGRRAPRRCAARRCWGRARRRGAPGPPCAARAPRPRWPSWATCCTRRAASRARSSWPASSACTSRTASGPRCARRRARARRPPRRRTARRLRPPSVASCRQPGARRVHSYLKLSSRRAGRSHSTMAEISMEPVGAFCISDDLELFIDIFVKYYLVLDDTTNIPRDVRLRFCVYWYFIYFIRN